jgi:hypothetical protein
MSRRSARKNSLFHNEASRRIVGRRPSTTRTTSTGVCVYCQDRPATTVDHVFAKGFFERPLPKMLTVPVCDECNRGTGDGIARPMSMDEEYMRTALTMTEAAERHPVAVKVFEQVVNPSFSRRPKLAASIVNTTKVFHAFTQSGLALPYSRLAFQIDLSRFERVLRKIGKGLFYSFAKRPLPRDAVITIIPRLNQAAADLTVAGLREMPTIGPVGMQDNAIVFWGVVHADPPAAMWLIHFYRTWAASILVEPPLSNASK